MSISVRNITKLYGTQHAVEKLSFEVSAHEIVGFLGPNGAGKSTTMKIVTGYIPPTEGTAVIANEFDVREHPLEARKRIGYLPEHNPLYLDMYVHEYLLFAGGLHGLRGKLLKNKVKEVVDRTGLGPEQHKKLSALSKGYRQRAGLAQALLHDPQVLILDEPTSGLDPNQVVEIRRLIQELGREKAVLFSSHILSEVEAIANRVVIIHKGKLVQDSDIQAVRERNITVAVLELEVEHPGFDFAAFTALVGFRSVQPQSETRFNLQADPGTDLRKLAYDESIRQNNAILSLTMKTAQLEDVFRELTGQDAPAAN
jgi:ABC-2 type transport system ATP-binding protein